MKELSNIETYFLLAGGLLMVIGAGASIIVSAWAAYLFALGAILFTAMQMKQTYSGHNITIKRLRRMVLFSDILMLIAGLLMIADKIGFVTQISYITYLQYVHNNWTVVLLVAAILQLYASHRIASELEKDAK